MCGKMTDDIVTRLNTEDMTKAYYKAFPTVVTLENAMRQALQAVAEIERLRAELEYVRDVELGECRSEYTKISNKYYRLLKEQ